MHYTFNTSQFISNAPLGSEVDANSGCLWATPPPPLSSRPPARDTEPIRTRRALGCQRYKQKRKPKERKGVPRWPGFSYSEACLACPGKRRSCYTKPGLVQHATEKRSCRGVDEWKELDDEFRERGMNTNGCLLSSRVTSSSRRIPDWPHVSRSSSAWDQKFSSWSGSVPSCPTVNLFETQTCRFNHLVHQNSGSQWAGRHHSDERKGRPMICAGYGGALEERHIHGAVGHTVIGGDVLVDCGALGYEVKGPDWFGEAVQVNRHTALNLTCCLRLNRWAAWMPCNGRSASINNTNIKPVHSVFQCFRLYILCRTHFEGLHLKSIIKPLSNDKEICVGEVLHYTVLHI